MRIGGIITASISIIVVVLVLYTLTATVTQIMPDANANDRDQHGNNIIGYFDVSASIATGWSLRNDTCSQPCEIDNKELIVAVEQHAQFEQTPPPRTVPGQFVSWGGCEVSVNLEVIDPYDFTIAEQESLHKTITVGKNLEVAWGHVFVTTTGWHSLYFTIWVYGGDGCPYYANLDKPVKLDYTRASYGFSFIGE